MKLTIAENLASPARKSAPERAVVRVAAVQVSWRSDENEHRANLELGIRKAFEAGAKIVFLPELSLSRYPADVCPTGVPSDTAEPLVGGETFRFVAALAKELGYFHSRIAVRGNWLCRWQRSKHRNRD